MDMEKKKFSYALINYKDGTTETLKITVLEEGLLGCFRIVTVDGNIVLIPTRNVARIQLYEE